MAIHLCRDYLTQNVTTNARSWIFAYLLAIFTRRILQYSYVGNTNFNINTVGSYLIATGDTTPSAAPTFPVGKKARINLGYQKEFNVAIPSSVRTVSVADIGRLLVLKSVTYPTFNSGIFLIVGIDSVTNSYVIDYRTLGETPPAEPLDSLQWWLYEKDVSCPTQGAPNTLKAATEYRGDGNSTTPRIILQSPHALGWQVRICNESSGDYAVNRSTSQGNCPQSSAIPGFGGNSSGDFSSGGQNCHAPLWYNSSHPSYLGGAPGFGDGGGYTGTQYRVTIIGDDTGQGITMYCRRSITNSGYLDSPGHSITSFGLAENEPLPLPINNCARLFVIGSGLSGPSDFYTSQPGRGLNQGSLQVGVCQNSIENFIGYCQGMSQAPFGVPISCAPSMLAYITGTEQGYGPASDLYAADCPFVNSTELMPIDLIQGTIARWTNFDPAGGSLVYPLAPKLMGTIPHIRYGRSNFGEFSPTTEIGRSYQHLRRGIYIPWNGPNLIP